MAISIVIPAYNEEQFIVHTLASLAAQTYRDFEVVIAVTGTDHTKDVAQIFLEKQSIPYQFVFPEKKGVALARQTATAAAKYPIIASTDADAVLQPSWLQQINAIFSAQPQTVAVYGPVYFKDGKWIYRMASHRLYPVFLRVSRWCGNDNAAGNNFAFRAHAFQQVGGYNTTLASCEDIDLIKKIKTKGKILYDPALIVFVSARRMQEGIIPFLSHHAKNYIRTYISHKPPADFTDIRSL